MLPGFLTNVAITEHANAKDDETVEARRLEGCSVGLHHVLEEVYTSDIGSQSTAEEELQEQSSRQSVAPHSVGVVVQSAQ
jgi:hypothetical protein